jgi:hypothetical protein
MRTATKRRFELAGWILFIVSAVFFTWASWRDGDPLALSGSLFFLFACLVFLVPLHGHRVPEGEGREQG